MRIGGTEQVIKNLIEGNHSKDIEMSIYCIEQPLGPFGKLLADNGIEIHSTNRSPGFDISVIKSIRRHIKQHKIDIVHCHQYTPWVYGTFAAIATRTKVVFTEHGRFYPDRSSWKRKYINPLLSRLTDAKTAISYATKQALVDFEYLKGDEIDVIYNGIVPLEAKQDDAVRLKKSLGIPATFKVIGTISRFDPIKNHAMMLDAFKLVLEQQPDTVLLIVGDGEERTNIEARIEAHDLSSRVVLTGYISQPADYLACMDIFLLSSLSEGTSMTLLEAMSLSKPCVVTDAGGNREIISHGENGLVTPNDDAEAFSNAIIEILVDEDEYKRMSKASQNLFRKKFSSNHMVDAYHKVYRDLL
jgi:glycosyltransferase involved in cell wall biosynthesis